MIIHEKWRRLRQLILAIYRNDRGTIIFDTDLALQKGYNVIEQKAAEQIILKNEDGIEVPVELRQKLVSLFDAISVKPKIYVLPEIGVIFIYVPELNIEFTMTVEHLNSTLARANKKIIQP